jgi:hypothetical protein
MDKPYYLSIFGTSKHFSDTNSAAISGLCSNSAIKGPNAPCNANCMSFFIASAAAIFCARENEHFVQGNMQAAMPVLVFEIVYMVFYASHVIAA